LDRRDDLSEAEFPQRGRDIEAEMLVSLEEAARGAIRPISLRLTRRCERCQGTGQGRNRRPCPACGGKGQITDIKQYRVGIPAGVRDGQRLRLAGRGQAGVGNGPPGDLFLIVRLAKHPDFRVEGSDLYVDVELAPWEAVLGANVSVPTLQGNVNIIIPAGSQNGQKLRLRERGLPSSEGGSGDLYAVLNIQVPKRLSERERALWEQLARESSFKPRE
jgi:DnaJ-class molecular chaperone